MSFKDDFTISELVMKEDAKLKALSAEELLQLPKDTKLEKEKTVLSNDFYMLGQYLECLSNKMVK
jgi:hypothetical protein